MALGARVDDAEPALVQVVVEIDRRPFEIHQAALIDENGYAVEVEALVELLVVDRIEIELVLEAGAAAADDAQPQVDHLREVAGFALLGDDAPDLAGRLLGDDD